MSVTWIRSSRFDFQFYESWENRYAGKRRS